LNLKLRLHFHAQKKRKVIKERRFEPANGANGESLVERAHDLGVLVRLATDLKERALGQVRLTPEPLTTPKKEKVKI